MDRYIDAYSVFISGKNSNGITVTLRIFMHRSFNFFRKKKGMCDIKVISYLNDNQFDN